MSKMRTAYKSEYIQANKIFSNGIARINMESISIIKYRELTEHLVCALRNYEMSSTLDDRSYALVIISNVTRSILDIKCNGASVQDTVAMNSALKKAQETIRLCPIPTLVAHTQTGAHH